MLFAERLKELRQERNLSQTALAQIIGVSQKAIDYCMSQNIKAIRLDVLGGNIPASKL